METTVPEYTSVQSRLMDPSKIATTNDDEESRVFFNRLSQLVPTCEYMFGSSPKYTNPANYNQVEQKSQSADQASSHQYVCNCANLDNNVLSDSCTNNRIGNTVPCCDAPKSTDCLSCSQCSCTHKNYCNSSSKNNMVVTTKRNRHRINPYKISKEDRHNSRKIYDVNSLQNNKHKQTADLPSSFDGKTEHKLEILNNVIEYINSLQRVLNNSPKNNPTSAEEAKESVEQDRRALESVAPVDRVMEILEYKTGAITITA